MVDQAAPSHSLSATLSGVAGEYFVAAELSRRGYIAALTLKNSRGIDILVRRPGGKHMVSVQVKTAQGAANEWLLSNKDEEASADNHFYVFVALNKMGTPSFHIAPSKIVAERCAKNHQSWLAEPKRNDKPRKDTSMRVFRPGDEFRDQWKLLGLDA